jgi:hypothetical protein
MLKLVSFHIQAHLNVFLQILEFFSQNVEVDSSNLLTYSVFEFFDCAGGRGVVCFLQHAPLHYVILQARYVLIHVYMISSLALSCS